MEGNFGNRGFTPPVSEGEEIEVSIEAVGEKGDGIAKKNGFVIFVPDTQQGDNVKIKVTKVLRKVAFAEVIGDAEAPAEESDEDADESEDSDEASDEEKKEAADEEATDDSDEEKKEQSEDTEDF